MGKDRQSKKLIKEGRVETDRDQSLHYPGSSKLESADAARKRQRT
ncbi:YpzI family protein [Evansella tamaricis]|uniref:YpzI family protein n=1 Tax=Evansella tamaricis TaxID=2069301 RepID=A0ABS6JIG1_9BACI|nr:YpzI family protein [Evansella tamaricis]MBU9713455.1 YpzI family protein [Evansella tamaricis]